METGVNYHEAHGLLLDAFEQDLSRAKKNRDVDGIGLATSNILRYNDLVGEHGFDLKSKGLDGYLKMYHARESFNTKFFR